MLVTHDPLDALVLADRLVIVEDGRVVQEGDAGRASPRRPRTDYVARLVGLNLYRGRGRRAHGAAGRRVRRCTAADQLDGDAFVAFPPVRRRAAPHPARRQPAQHLAGHASPASSATATTCASSSTGPIAAAADVTPAAAAELDLTPGQQVWAAVKATETHAYPA